MVKPQGWQLLSVPKLNHGAPMLGTIKAAWRWVTFMGDGEGAVTDCSWPLQSYYTAVSILKLVINCGLQNPLKQNSRLVFQIIWMLLLCGTRTLGLAPGGFLVGWFRFFFFVGFLFGWFWFSTLLFDLKPFICFSFSFLLFVCPFHLLFRGSSWVPHAVCTAPGEWGPWVSQSLWLVAET